MKDQSVIFPWLDLGSRTPRKEVLVERVLVEKRLSVLAKGSAHFAVRATSARLKFSFRIEREKMCISYTKRHEESKQKLPFLYLVGRDSALDLKLQLCARCKWLVKQTR